MPSPITGSALVRIIPSASCTASNLFNISRKFRIVCPSFANNINNFWYCSVKPRLANRIMASSPSPRYTNVHSSPIWSMNTQDFYTVSVFEWTTDRVIAREQRWRWTAVGNQSWCSVKFFGNLWPLPCNHYTSTWPVLSDKSQNDALLWHHSTDFEFMKKYYDIIAELTKNKWWLKLWQRRQCRVGTQIGHGCIHISFPPPNVTNWVGRRGAYQPETTPQAGIWE